MLHLGCAAQARDLGAEREKKLPAIDSKQQEVDKRGRLIASLLTRINEMKDRIFADFSRKVRLCYAAVRDREGGSYYGDAALLGSHPALNLTT